MFKVHLFQGPKKECVRIVQDETRALAIVDRVTRRLRGTSFTVSITDTESEQTVVAYVERRIREVFTRADRPIPYRLTVKGESSN